MKQWVIVTVRGHIYHADDATWVDDRLNDLNGYEEKGVFAISWMSKNRDGPEWRNYVPITALERVSILQEP